MRNLLRAAVAVAALLAMPLTALAADKGGPAKPFDEIAKPADKAPSWTGLYIGVVGGYDMQNTEIGGLLNFQAKDFSYGVAAGADYRIPTTQIVVGIMVDYVKSNASSALTTLDGSWSVLARGGILFSPTTLVYGGAGYTFEDVGGATAALDLDKGFTLAVGVETYIFKNVTLKAEYRWVDEGTAMGGAFESTTQSARLGLNYRF